MPRRRSLTDDDLRSAVAAADSYAAVLRNLGLKRGGGTYVAVRVRIAALGIVDSHLGTEERLRRTDQRRRRAAADAELQTRRSWTDDDLRDAVTTARSLNGVFAALGLVGGCGQPFDRGRAS